jgi:hypothetical protein
MEERALAEETQDRAGRFRRRDVVATDTEHRVKRDPLVDHVVPLAAKAMLATEDTEELWVYLRQRVEAECHRMKDDAIREALEPLEERFPIEAIARVAAARAQQAVAQAD